MKAFISSLLAYDPNQQDLEGGILGVVNGYYGCVEAQGRGTLHCHMIIWLEGGLNPNEIKDRVLKDGDTKFRDQLIAFLDDTISNFIPDNPNSNLMPLSSQYHPCSVRCPEYTTNSENAKNFMQKDLHNIVKSCQVHRHSKTCYKYWTGPPQPKECRFNLDESHIVPITSFDMETGEVSFRCLDGLVNNFNETILQTMRCNMDIKFIGSGPAAKAIIYYITNYITKTQLKTHVAYAALELSVKKLGEFNPADDELTVYAKKLLQKCAYAMISHQELSGQQVASYLMDYEDHFTSHQFRNLYWTSFEAFINQQDPSPECYYQTHNVSESDPENETENSISEVNNSVEDLITNLEENTNRDCDDESEEVIVTVDTTTNKLIAKASQIVDYQLRASKFSNLSVWDFVTSIDKVRIKKIKNQDDIDSETNILETDNCNIENEFTDKIHTLTPNDKNSDIYFQNGHCEQKTHQQKLRSSEKLYVAVPIGPALPRRDVNNIRAKYCRLMLILFKPWRNAQDLRKSGQSWEDAFCEFDLCCSKVVKKKMTNMQLLHECRENGIDHFASRRNKKNKMQQIPLELSNQSAHEHADDFGHTDQSAILAHLESISSCHSQKLARSSASVNDSLLAAELSGMYNTDSNQISSHNLVSNDEEQEIFHSQDLIEDTWRHEYDKRQDMWKQKTVISDISSTNTVHNNINTVITDGSQLRDALNAEKSLLPTYSQGLPPEIIEHQVSIDTIIEEFTLNTEQARAFRIISEHSLNKNNEQLKMYLGGAGGTGKSRVINALREFFIRCGQKRRFRLASYTGVAAKNISGMTIHSALGLNQRKKGNHTSKTNNDLQAMWEGVDYFFIDEISMIGCSLLYNISEALVEAKGNSAPFGGINVIFAGDFAQLPPVGETRLSAMIDTSQTKSSSKRGQENAYGKLLWLSINKAVILDESMRQSGPENVELIGLLSRLREGRCNHDDYHLLSKRVLNNINVPWKEWHEAPIIVTENAQKDALNERATKAFADRTNHKLHWYYAIDTHQGKNVSKDIQNHLLSLNSGITNQRLGKIPLVIGMPVMITQNYDVEGGIVNGCTGILKKIRYTTDSNGNRYALSCVVESPTISADPLSTLPKHHAVVLQDTIDLKFRHPHSGKNCQIKRTQLPITPAFAMTAHKSQGQTMKKVIIDLEGCRGTEAPYVMVSRVTSLEGLLILRPFNYAKISCHQSQDTRNEFKRLNNIRLKTTAETENILEKDTALNITSSTYSPSNTNGESQNVRPNADVNLHFSLQPTRQKKKITGARNNNICNDDPSRISLPNSPSTTTDTTLALISSHKKRQIDMTINDSEVPLPKKRKRLQH